LTQPGVVRERYRGRTAARAVAFYLPQFHPIPENDAWWGGGFTEWTNVARARRRFPGHYQPRIPGELGFYDLRLAESREQQATLAAEYGISAFCYWHYWFGHGRRLLERPFAEVLASGRPDFPFCLGWANQTWSGVWHGAPGRVLVQQEYPGDDDYRAHFDAVLPAFGDARYFRVDGKPLFYVFNPDDLPSPERFVEHWRELAQAAGLPGIYLVANAWATHRARNAEFDAFVMERVPTRRVGRVDLARNLARALGFPIVRSYPRFSSKMPVLLPGRMSYPCVVPQWDNTPRSGKRGVVLHGASPPVFEAQVRRGLELMADRDFEHRVIFVKSWNEWAEGNYLEPDRRYGRAFLEAFKAGLQVKDGLDLG
jgi:Glycosyltransferase WbsX